MRSYVQSLACMHNNTDTMSYSVRSFFCCCCCSLAVTVFFLGLSSILQDCELNLSFPQTTATTITITITHTTIIIITTTTITCVPLPVKDMEPLHHPHPTSAAHPQHPEDSPAPSAHTANTNMSTHLPIYSHVGVIYTTAWSEPELCSLHAWWGPTRLHLQSWPSLNQKFPVIITPNASSVCNTSRPQGCIPDSNWHTVECELCSALLWSWNECSSLLSQDGRV